MMIAAAQTFDDAGFAVSAEGYDELAGVLRNSGCGRTFSGNGYLDINNLALEHGEPSKDVQENMGAEIAGGDIPLDKEERQVIDEILRMLSEATDTTPVPLIRDTFPCVCYFHREEDRRYFMEETASEEETVKVVALPGSR